jgi:hypothetical protein
VLPITVNAGLFSRENIKEIDFNFGSHTEFYNNVQIDDSGGMRKFDFAPTLGAGLLLPYNDFFKIIPEFNWVLPRFIEDQKIMINLFMVRGDVAFDPMTWLRLRLGTSIMILNQHGRGGSTTMNNGNTQTRFFYPDRNHSSINNTFDLGVETLFNSWSLRFQTYTYSIFDKAHQQISYSLFVTYHWEQE